MARIKTYTAEQIAKSREAGHLTAQVLSMIKPYVQPGVSTDKLDQLCFEYITDELKCIPANVGYHGFPKTICSSVNQVVCHGIPSRTEILKEGDIINIDVALIKDGWFGDTSRMYMVGDVSPHAKLLVETTYQAMMSGIQAVKPGARLGDIGYAIQSVAHTQGYSVVREYCGHGIGQQYHMDPDVVHFGAQGKGLQLVPGMIFTIEPMINAGQSGTKVLSDEWTVVTKDRSLSAQWEHMVVVTEDGYEILTPWPDA